MREESKTKNERIYESLMLRKRMDELRSAEIERKKIGEELQEKESFLSNIFSSIQDGISVLDEDMNIVRVNPAMEKWYKHAMPLVGKKCYVAYHGRNEPCEICPTQKTLKTGNAAYEVVPKTGEDGKIIGWLDLYSFPLIDRATGHLTGVIEYVRDITERKRAEEKRKELSEELFKSNNKLKQLALKDSHTGLYNHRYLEEVIEAEYYRARRYVHPLSLVMIDIDYFKSINDVYGHDFGDKVLKQFAMYIKKKVRRCDIVIRSSGEEFVVILPNTGGEKARILAQRLLDSIKIFGFGNGEHEVRLKLSIAVVSCPNSSVTRGMDLINLADRILSRAKDEGGDRVYSSSDMKAEKTAMAANGRKKAVDIKFLKSKITKLTKRGNQSVVEAILAFAKTIELKDHYTGEHAEKTVQYAIEIAKELNLSQKEVDSIRQAAVLHDLGKIGISDKILSKRSKLNRKEFAEIKKHSQIGADIIRPIHFMRDIIPLVLYHHERWDGKGYPAGLKGDKIPLGARIISLADVFQALTSDRPYRKAYSEKGAIKIIKEGSGTQFDPMVVDVFLKILRREK